MTRTITVYYDDKRGYQAPLEVTGVIELIHSESQYNGDFVVLEQVNGGSTLVFLRTVLYITEELE